MSGRNIPRHRGPAPRRAPEPPAVLSLERHLRHPPEVVWRALTEPAEIARWLLTEARVEPRVGGRVEFVTGPAKVAATGAILAWDPPRRYEYEWTTPAGPSFPEGERSIVRWELRPADGGTLLCLRHEKLSDRTARGFRVGMEAFLDRLEAQLDGRPLPDWEARIRLRAGGAPVWG